MIGQVPKKKGSGKQEKVHYGNTQMHQWDTGKIIMWNITMHNHSVGLGKWREEEQEI